MEDIATFDPNYTLDPATRGFTLAAIRYIWGFDSEFNSLRLDDETKLVTETEAKIVNHLVATADWLEKHDDWTQLIANSKFERPNLSEFSEEPDYEGENAGRYINYEEALELLKNSHSEITSRVAKLAQLQNIKLAPGCQLATHSTSDKGHWLYKITKPNEEIVLLDQQEHDVLKRLIEKKKTFAELSTKEKEWIDSLLLERIVVKFQ